MRVTLDSIGVLNSDQVSNQMLIASIIRSNAGPEFYVLVKSVADLDYYFPGCLNRDSYAFILNKGRHLYLRRGSDLSIKQAIRLTSHPELQYVFLDVEKDISDLETVIIQNPVSVYEGSLTYSFKVDWSEAKAGDYFLVYSNANPLPHLFYWVDAAGDESPIYGNDVSSTTEILTTLSEEEQSALIENWLLADNYRKSNGSYYRLGAFEPVLYYHGVTVTSDFQLNCDLLVKASESHKIADFIPRVQGLIDFSLEVDDSIRIRLNGREEKWDNILLEGSQSKLVEFIPYDLDPLTDVKVELLRFPEVTNDVSSFITKLKEAEYLDYYILLLLDDSLASDEYSIQLSEFSEMIESYALVSNHCEGKYCLSYPTKLYRGEIEVLPYLAFLELVISGEYLGEVQGYRLGSELHDIYNFDNYLTTVDGVQFKTHSVLSDLVKLEFKKRLNAKLSNLLSSQSYLYSTVVASTQEEVKLIKSAEVSSSTTSKNTTTLEVKVELPNLIESNKLIKIIVNNG